MEYCGILVDEIDSLATYTRWTLNFERLLLHNWELKSLLPEGVTMHIVPFSDSKTKEDASRLQNGNSNNGKMEFTDRKVKSSDKHDDIDMKDVKTEPVMKLHIGGLEKKEGW